MRTDVRTEKYNCEQFNFALEYILNHPSIGDMNFFGVDKFLDYLEATNYKSSRYS
jgi:hypothetical protein